MFTICAKCYIVFIAGLHCKPVLWKRFLQLSTNSSTLVSSTIPANIYTFRVKTENITKKCEIFSKLAIKTPERHH